MMLLCLFAIFVSVQCTLLDYSKVKTFDLENVPQYDAVVDNLRVRKNSYAKVRISYAIGNAISEDFRQLVVDILLPYLQEETCLEFREISLKKIDKFDSRFLLIFAETEDTLVNCFELRGGYKNGNQRSGILSVILNEECVRQKVKDRRDGKTDSRVDLSKWLSDEYCKLR